MRIPVRATYIHGTVLQLTSGSYMWQHGPHPKGPGLTMHFLFTEVMMVQLAFIMGIVQPLHDALVSLCNLPYYSIGVFK